MDADAKALLLVLPSPEDRQDVLRFRRSRREQRMPAVLFRPGSDLAADDGANGLLGILAFEHGLGFGEANLLGRSIDAHAWLQERHEQATGQLLPGMQAVRVATGTHGDIQ